ncbi:uncharacterized protein LOC126792755 [Argentina anserina]|uniref:uncharacterized protein LOC126792755 n=1 Tax=Argentina anserina TaxID=57926 RepID=UPI002176279F|nr:uncharacterized protein LOC126792755 [Potentilla anserina]XP_050375182.1 uncharacterized protein LOC126792755 [Potentilla anserina]XP_050375183.1 uncharacterized protein LOC126792755 [Potentilla anserina]
MEEPTQISNHTPNSVKTPHHLQSNTKKRTLDSDARNSTSKIRALLRDIRPNVLEVLRTPDFQKCKAANEIQEQVKVLMELYKQMTPEALTAPKCNNVPEGQLSSGALLEDELPSGVAGEKQQAEDGQNRGTCVVGGSAFGWNFITFSSMGPLYYGMTKELFRAQAAKLTTI